MRLFSFFLAMHTLFCLLLLLPIGLPVSASSELFFMAPPIPEIVLDKPYGWSSSSKLPNETSEFGRLFNERPRDVSADDLAKNFAERLKDASAMRRALKCSSREDQIGLNDPRVLDSLFSSAGIGPGDGAEAPHLESIFSQECAKCIANVASCLSAHCKMACRNGRAASECGLCIRPRCNEYLFACGGVTFQREQRGSL